MTGRTLARGAAVLVLVVAGVFVLWFRPRDDPQRSLGGGRAQLAGPAAELASLMRKGHGVTYHASYRATGAVVPKGGSLTIEAWRRGELVRVDQTVKAADQVVRSAFFELGDRSVVCTRRDEAKWRCSRAVDVSRSDPLIGRIAADLEGREVTVEEKKVNRRPARCFMIDSGEETSEVCLSSDGIPLRFGAGRDQLELTDLERKVDVTVFRPPAG